MNLFLVGATGRSGKWLLKAALEHGHSVTALVREPVDRIAAHDRLKIISGDLFEIENLSERLLNHDAIISALDSRSVARGTDRLIDCAKKAKVDRFIGIAGGGILQLDQNLLRRDRPNYPKMFLESSAQHLHAWKALQSSSLVWTLFCTPDLKDLGPTGKAALKADYMPEGGNSVALGDIAFFVMLELERREFLNKRVGCTQAISTDSRHLLP